MPGGIETATGRAEGQPLEGSKPTHFLTLRLTDKTGKSGNAYVYFRQYELASVVNVMCDKGAPCAEFAGGTFGIVIVPDDNTTEAE